MLSEPVVGKDFFGREETISLLDKRLKAMRDGYRQNVAITGQSLAGKSSLLQHFLYTSIDDSFLPIYIEVLKEDFSSFANRFIATLLYNSLKTKEETRPDDVDGLIRKAERFFPKTVSNIKTILLEIERHQLDEAYANLLNLTSVVKEETAKLCIVILDEFDNISNFKIKNPFLIFGKVIMIQKDTMYIIASSRNSAIKKILQEKLSLLFGNFEVVDLRGFDANSAGSFLEKKAYPLSIDNDLKRFLIFFTDGNPFYIEQIAHEAKNIARERSRQIIDLEFIEEAIVNLVYGANGTIHQYMTNLLYDLVETRLRDSLVPLLASIASGHKKQRDIAKDLKICYSDISKSLYRLMDLGLISKKGIFWTVSDRMLDFWLAHVYLKKQQMLVNYIVDRTKSNRDAIHTYIVEFLQESKRPIVDRICALFNLFSGELVDIEDKKFVLPQSDKVEVKTFDDVTAYILASSKDKAWICQIFERPISEPEIAEFIKEIKSLARKVERKILIPLNGIEENAKLLAKELRISIWDLETVNMLFGLYDKMGIVHL